MPERSTVAQVVQIGRETTPGTPVPATKRLGTMTLTPGISTENQVFRPAGLKYPTVVAVTKEWSEVGVDGAPSYEEVLYPLSGACGAPSSAAAAQAAAEGGAGSVVGAYEHVFSPKSAGADAPVTYTLENGEPGVATGEQFAHLLFTGFSLDVSRDEVSMGGDAFAMRATSGATPTPGLSLPAALTPILPQQVSVYLGALQADLDAQTGLLTRVISLNPQVGDRYNPAWFVNAANPSFTTFVENPDGNTSDMELVTEADAAGMLWLGRMRAGTTHLLRMEAKGPLIGASNVRYLFRWDQAVKVSEVGEFSDEDGIYAMSWTLQPVHDVTAGYAQRITVRNGVATL